MSSCRVQQAGAIELLFYGELTGRERLEVQEHLSRCAECRRALDELQLIRQVLATRPAVSAPAGGDWTPFMTRLSEAIARESVSALAVAGPPARIAIRHGALGGYVGYFAMAAMLVLVTLSVAYLAQSRDAWQRDAELTVVPARAEEQPQGAVSIDSAFASLSEQHFERSKLVVLGLLNKDPGKPADWEYERQLASALLSETRLYRQAAEERGFTRLARIMDDLELVLLQASLVEEPQPETLEQIQRLIEKRDLIAKMNVVTTIAGL